MSRTMRIYLGIVGWALGVIMLVNAALWSISIKGSWGNVAVLVGALLLIGAGALVLLGVTRAAKMIEPPSQKDDNT